MSTEALYQPPLMPHLLIEGLLIAARAIGSVTATTCMTPPFSTEPATTSSKFGPGRGSAQPARTSAHAPAEISRERLAPNI